MHTVYTRPSQLNAARMAQADDTFTRELRWLRASRWCELALIGANLLGLAAWAWGAFHA